MATRHEITSIQFKADAGKANAAIDSIRQKAKEANDQMAQLRQKLEEGKKANLPVEDLKKMEDQLKSATKEAKQWGDAQRNLMRGVKALDEAIIQFNRGQGSVEKMSAALSKAARNAAQLQQSRMERGSQGWQEMEALITALDKNLVKARQDFDGLVQTIEAGGRVSVSELTSAKQSLKELSDLTAYGSKEWKAYDAQLTTVSEKLRELAIEQQRATGKDTLGRAFRGDFAGADAKTLEQTITKLKEYQSVIDDPRGKGARHFAAAKTQIEALTTQLNNTKGVIATVEAAMQKATDITGRQVTSASEHIARATAATRSNIAAVDGKIESTTAEIRKLEAAMDAINQPQNVAPLIAQMEQTTAEIQRQHTAKEQFIKTSEQEHLARERAIEEQRAMVAWAVAEKKAYENNIKSLEGQIKYEEEHLKLLKETQAQMRTQKDGTVAQPSAEDLALIEQHEKIIAKIKERKAAMEAANKTTSQLTEANERLAAAIKADEEATAQAQKAIQAFDAQIASTESSVTQLQQQMNAMYNPATVKQMEAELANLTAEFNRQKEARAQLLTQSEAERAERQRNIDSLKQQIAKLKEENQRALDGYIAKSNAIDDEMAKLRTLQRVREKNAQAIERDNYTEDKAFTEKTGWRPKSLEERYPLENIDRMIESTQRSIAALEKERDAMDASLTSTSEKLGTATKDLEQATREHAQATETARNAIRQYDEQIKKLETDIANYTQQLQAAKSAQNTQEYQRMAQQLQQLQGNLASMVAEREQYVATMQQEEEAAKRLAEAEKAEAVAAQKNVTQEQVEQSIKVLEDNRRKIVANTDEWNRQGDALEVLQEKLRQMKGEMMSLAEAEALADKAMEEQALTTKTGWAASTEELKRAEQTLADKVAKAKRGTAEEEAAYQKLVRQLQAVRTELGAGSMSGKQMMDVLSNPKNVTSVDTLKAAIGRARQELDALGQRIDQARQSGQTGEVKKLQKVYDDLAKSVQQTDIRMKELQNSSKGTASAFDKAWSRLKTYVGLYVGAAVAMQKLTQAMGDLLELSDRMGEVRKTTGFTADEVGRLSENLAKLDTRTTLTQLMELSSLAGSVGLKTQEQVQGFTEAADQLIVALPELGNESARTIIKIANATGDLEKNGGNVRETLEKVGSTIIALRANSASAAGPITDFVSRVGAVGAQAGISIDQIAALGSTIDALGGRVEMSATALSRMIPAIKNNSFAIANSIGVTEKYLKSLAPMEQMVLIFQKMRDNIQHIDTSTEEGMNAMADNVEAMLGKNATMREVMKDLEQQGARAGIVFGLLSQNVDELQKQLGIASEAYRENTALANEFNNMNETTAAKWERLKNQVEEMFVGDQAQRWLGTIIDWLRKIVDFIAEDGPIVQGLKLIAVYAAAMKMEIGAAVTSAGGAFKNLGIAIGAGINQLGIFTRATAAARVEWKAMDAAMKANIWGAVIAALGAIAFKIWDIQRAAKEAAAEIGRFNQKLTDEKKALDDLFTPLQKSNIAQDERSKLISEINSKYGRYLGFMLSETNSAIQLADAHALIAKRIREEAYEKRILDQENKVMEKYNEDMSIRYGEIYKQVAAGVRGNTDATEVSSFLKGLIDRNLDKAEVSMMRPAWSHELQETVNGALERLVSDGKLSRQSMSRISYSLLMYTKTAKEQSDEISRVTAATRADLRNAQRSVKEEVNAGLNGLVNNLKNFGQTSASTTPMAGTQRQSVGKPFQWGKQENGETPDWVWNPKKRSQQQVQMPLLDWKPNIDKKNIEQVKRYVEAQDQLRSYLEANAGRIDEQTRKTAEMYLESEESMKELRSLIPSGSGGGSGSGGSGGGGGTNPYGIYNRVTSPYQDWDADALVSRRKEMLERVRALANGADVQAVLSEDTKFITEATRKNIKDTKQAIEWYNTERLKIQDALHEKHLTNTGDWMDPTGRKKREKTVKEEWSTYLNELDAYYTERKAKIQEQQNDGEISEAESWRRQLTNEAEWRQRRAELQQLYARKSAEVTEEEQQAIFNIIGERTGDSADFIRAYIAKTVQFIYDIGKHSEAEMNNLFGRMDKGSEQDFLRQRNAIGKQMDAIRDIIEKERPFNGITENLQKNLTKMGVLFGDMDDEMKRLMAAGEDMAEFNAKQEQERVRRLSFLLQEAEHAYNTNIEEVMRHMAEAGMTAWVDYFKNNTDAQNALMAQLHTTFDKVQEAIKKEASLWKKEAENMWNNILLPDGETTLKQLADRTVAALSLDENRVKRANSLIGAGQASERVADRLALQQMKVQLAMQEHYYNIMHQRGRAAIDDLERQAKLARERGDIEEATRKELEAQHARMTLNLATAKEETDLAKQREEIIARTEESQNRLYTELKEWADLLTSSLQSVFEATHAGDAEYYNELAKLNLTGKGGPGAGTYIVIDNEGTSDATAHYEYLDEREALERQHEIERENAIADAWKKVMDDINTKMSETITDQLNAMLQNQSLDANTQAVLANTEALYATSGRGGGADMGIGADGIPNALRPPMEGENNPAVGDSPTDMNGYTAPWQQQPQGEQSDWQVTVAPPEVDAESYTAPWAAYADASKKTTETAIGNNKKIEKSTKQSFAAMTAAANMYGIAYQAMSNENLNTAQKVEMMIVQAAGQAMISMLTASLAADTAESASHAPAWISKTLKELGPIGGPVAVGVFTALIGGLMGLAASKITKSKSQIAQVTGASSASAGRLATGMLTYAEGNVNEFTDPSSLTPGKQYNVDAADGRTYRARYMGRNPKTHLTNGPEFHLSGERGREMIIDAGTTRQITMNEGEIWHAIQTLSGGGSARRFARRGRGITAFADGNIEDFVDGSVSGDSVAGMSGMSAEQAASLQASIDRQSDLLEDLRINGIKATFDVYGKGGLVDSYDSGKKTLNRYGQRY